MNRYKVIADYPNSPFKVGDILLQGNYVRIKFFSKHNYYKGNDETIDADDIVKYPHLFKKLEWWEDVPVEELPKYIKTNYRDIGGVYIIHKNEWIWSEINNQYWCLIEENGMWKRIFISRAIPSTEQEYEAYIKSKQ